MVEPETSMRFFPTKARGLVCAMTVLVAACGRGGEEGAPAPAARAAATGYVATSLVSDRAGANGIVHVDAQLVDAWGLAIAPRAFAWVANRGTSTSTRYNGDGDATAPAGRADSARPTGVVFDRSGAFRAGEGESAGPCMFIVVGDTGGVGCSAPDGAVRAVVGAAQGGAAYKGVAIARRDGESFLYATDFHHRSVDVFDARFARVAVAGGFVDPELPADYAPFGIQEIGNLLYVAYAKRGAAGRVEVTGAGLGLVDVFDAAGTLVRRLIAPGGKLDAPWGMAQAPADFGVFGNALLVANGGDGRIHAFDVWTGAFLGALAKPDGTPIVIDGLRGIAFGRGLFEQFADTPSLYFTAGPDGATHGTYGRIDIHQAID
jgi:uncharacterized protein (TIGR03118 family)